MKKKKIICLILILTLIICLTALPSKVNAAEKLITFSGTHFANTFYNAYEECDKNDDKKFTQSEIDTILYLTLSDTSNFTKQDFENLKYFKNVMAIQMSEAKFEGEIDLTGLTKLAYFEVDEVDQNNLPHFTVNDNVWLYTSPSTEWGYNEETSEYGSIYQEDKTSCFKLLSLWLGGPTEFYVGNDSYLSHPEAYQGFYNVKIAKNYNTIVSSNHSVADVELPSQYSTYTVQGYSAGTTTIKFTSSLGSRQRIYKIKSVDSKFTNNPATMSNNQKLKLYNDGRVLTPNGDLYEVNSSNYASTMKKVNSGVTEYLECYSGSIGGILKGSNLTIYYSKYKVDNGAYVEYQDATLEVKNVAHIYEGMKVLFKDGKLRKYSISFDTGDITYEDIATKVTDVNGYFFVANGKLGYCTNWGEYGTLNAINVTKITDSYEDFVQIGKDLYYVYFDSGLKYTKILSNLDYIKRTEYGYAISMKLTTGEELKTIDYSYEWNGSTYNGNYIIGDMINSYASGYLYSIKDYYGLKSNLQLICGNKDSVQLTKVFTAASIYNEDGKPKGVVALRSDNTVWYQSEPFKPWVKIFNLENLIFPDVPNGKWYTKAIEYVKDKGIISGYENGNFGVNDNISRGQIATILYRLAGKPSVTGKSKFPDVQDSGKYYYKAVVWASSNKIVNGYDNGNFGPNDNITRQELAVMLTNYSKIIAKKNVTSNYNLSEYKDYKNVSSWAQSSMKYIVEKKVISGNEKKDSNGNVLYRTLDPKNNATRAEAAAMFMRFCQSILGM